VGDHYHSEISFKESVMNGHVLYLSYDGLTDPLGQSQILPYIIGLSGKGYSFTVISFEKPDAFIKNFEIIQAQCKSSRIKWIPLKYHKQPPILSTLFDIYQLWRQCKKVYADNPFQIIHCRSYITSLVGLRAKRKWNMKFIFDMRGFWADERVEGGLWNLRNPVFKMIYNFFKRKEKQFLQQADHVVSLTYNAKQEIESWNIKSAPITVIPTCVDLDLFDPTKISKEDQASLRKKLGIQENDFVLLYLGSWGTWYLTNDMLNYFSILKKIKKETKFLIVSSDTIEIGICPFKNDILYVASPRHLVPLYISIADLSICFIKPSFSKKASSATKLNEILAMKVPVVTNSGWGDINLIDNDYVFVCKDLRNEKEVSIVLEKLNLKNTNINAESFSLSNGVVSYLKIFKGLIGE
jgi:glycosyltransferase involved in cell wall biosynthesis